ncbi:C40 family peptidase [Fulvivirga ligni]|uniref:C40 family peptidase n=1 Tax=Fulvivirga ligni TaxID=2904246 RepID=UPI001F3B1EBE|nr:NlpC/P60 family protein [Fulvivirga ligni]UII19808.1 C40 family peptidase [Fulvivirga ligni]
MKYLFLILFIVCGCASSTDQVSAIIENVEHHFAPDKRVALFDITYNNQILSGESNLPEAVQALKDSLNAKGVDYQDSITLLPTGEYTHGVIKVSVANLRAEGRHSSELVSQATMGTPVKVFRRHGDWIQVQTPDDYISWVDHGGIALMSDQEFNQWNDAEKLIFTHSIGYAYSDSTLQERATDLVAGDVVKLIKTNHSIYQIELPGGQLAFVSDDEVDDFSEWKRQEAEVSGLISTAKSMMGIPYLWGGTSVKGADCSGFTKTIYFMNRMIIPRDASQQVIEGDLVDDDKDWSKLSAGDLLFFGRPATDSTSEKVVHVGMWLGDSTFIHSSGNVHISSVDPKSDQYDEYNVNRYLRSKRIINKRTENVREIYF